MHVYEWDSVLYTWHNTLTNIRKQPWMLVFAFYFVWGRVSSFLQMCNPGKFAHGLLAPPPQFNRMQQSVGSTCTHEHASWAKSWSGFVVHEARVPREQFLISCSRNTAFSTSLAQILSIFSRKMPLNQFLMLIIQVFKLQVSNIQWIQIDSAFILSKAPVLHLSSGWLTSLGGS